jgi:hypothetical protein
MADIIKSMENKNLSSVDYQIFLYKSLFWLSLVSSGFALTLCGFFYAQIAWLLALAFGIWLVYHILKNNILHIISREMWIVSITLLLVVILFSLFSTPTVFSGRDQGSISEAAVRLVQNHTLEFSTPASQEFFKIYGPGRALNFPGFHYTNQGSLITQFPLIYIVWLASFYALFGITGFIIANAILMYIFLLSFYLLARMFLKTYSALPMIIFATTSFIFMWFSKFTLSENMALPLLWLTILALMLFLRDLRKIYYVVFLTAVGLLFFTRIEGIAFFVVSILIIFFHKNAREYVKRHSFKRFFLPIGIFAIAFIANLIKDINFYREVAKTLLPEVSLPQAQYLGTMKNTVMPIFYTERIFLLYGMLGFFIFGAISVGVFIWRKKIFKLVPFFIILPTFIYFLDAYITKDHPWMLRRFMFSLMPLAIFYSGLFIGQMLEKKFTTERKKILFVFSILVTVALIATNLITFSRYLTFSENQGLLSQTQALSEKFSNNDLVLIDNETTADGWDMISDPMSFLYGKNAVYFFNNNDLAKLDLKRFDKVYLIAPNKQVPFYLNSTIGNRLTEKDTYSFTFSKLNVAQDNPLETISLPEKQEITASGKIFEIAK